MCDSGPRTICTYYATRNRRAPFLMFIGRWPSRAAFFKTAMRGHRFYSRLATAEEEEIKAISPRHMAMKWTHLLGFVRWHRDEFGVEGSQPILQALRGHWEQIERVLQDSRKKQLAYERKKQRKRERAGRS